MLRTDPELRTRNAGEIHILTLNCWGVPIASHVPERFEAIGRRLARSDYDIVALQEVWGDEDWEMIRTVLRDDPHCTLRHAHRFKSGVVGSGIVILSRFPIIEASFQVFNATGKYYKFWHGDAFAGKGIAHAVVKAPTGLIHVFSTHAHASYDEHRVVHEEYHGVRMAQLLQLSKYIKHVAKYFPGMCVLMGDFNARPDSTEMRLLRLLSNFEDAFSVARESGLGNPRDMGYTCALENPYNTEGCLTAMIFPAPDTQYPCRIDYILYSNGRVAACNVAFNEHTVQVRGEKLGMPFSDHYGVEAILIPGEEQGTPVSEGIGTPTGEALTPTAVQVAMTETSVQMPKSASVGDLASEFDIKEDAPLSASRSPMARLLMKAVGILDHSIQEAKSRRTAFEISMWVVLLLTVVVETMLWVFMGDEAVDRVVALVVAIVLITIVLVFFALQKSMVPTEVTALEQARGEAGLLWRVSTQHRLSLTSDSMSVIVDEK